MRTNGQICRCVVDFLEEQRRKGSSWANSLWVLEANRRSHGKGRGNPRVKAKGERGNGQFARWENSSDEDEYADDSDAEQDDEADSNNDEDDADDEKSSSSDSDFDSDDGEPADGPRLKHTPFSEYLARVLFQLEAQISSFRSRHPSGSTRDRAFRRRCDLLFSVVEERVNGVPERNKLTEKDMTSCGSVKWIRDVERTVRGIVEQLEEHETSLAVDVGAKPA